MKNVYSLPNSLSQYHSERGLTDGEMNCLYSFCGAPGGISEKHRSHPPASAPHELNPILALHEIVPSLCSRPEKIIKEQGGVPPSWLLPVNFWVWYMQRGVNLIGVLLSSAVEAV